MNWKGYNTTSREDNEVSDATDEIESGMARLIEVINEFDTLIGEWREATNCDDPAAAEKLIELLKEEEL